MKTRHFIYRILAILLLVLLSPLFFLFYILIKLTSQGPFIFKQKRMGKGRKTFTIYKMRTMAEGAEKMREKYKSLNEVKKGPVFKIYDDPRYTGIGKFFAHSALDELPQLVNIIKGEMSFVGPRPLPVYEATKIPKKYRDRFTVLPGMTSSWIVKGAHQLSFDQWMKLDLDYVKKASFWYDMSIIGPTILLTIQSIIKSLSQQKK